MKLMLKLVAVIGGIGAQVASIAPAVAEPHSDVAAHAVEPSQRATATPDGVDRRRVADASDPLHAAIGRFTGSMVCTAAIVLHPRIIVTAGHCVAARNGTSREPAALFQPGYRAGHNLGRFAATLWAVGSPQSTASQSVHEVTNDWAILLLDGAPEGIRPLLLSDSSAKSAKSIGRAVVLPAYSDDIAGAQALSVDAGCSVTDVLGEMVIHDCNARYGSSGAPLLVRHRQWFAVLGIHTGAILGSDQDGNVTELIGNSAAGAWTFAEALELLLMRLHDEDIASESAHQFY